MMTVRVHVVVVDPARDGVQTVTGEASLLMVWLSQH